MIFFICNLCSMFAYIVSPYKEVLVLNVAIYKHAFLNDILMKNCEFGAATSKKELKVISVIKILIFILNLLKYAWM